MQFKTALVLGGGGVRGFAHIGVLKILKREKFPIDLILGTSIGAIIGAGFALYKDTEKINNFGHLVIEREELREIESFFREKPGTEERTILNRFNEIIKNISFLSKLRKKWIFDSERIRNLIKLLIPEKANFSDLKIPFACIATDIVTGETVTFKEGNLLDAVLASSSIPGVFPPQKLDNRYLMDGGIISKLPTHEARILGAKFILGVNVDVFRQAERIKDGIDIIFRVNHIMSYWLNKYNIKEADFVITPDLDGINWSSFSKGIFCMKKGEEITEQVFNDLKRAWRRKRFKSYFNLPFAICH